MKKKPLVSILIPNYNYAHTIADTIQSALNQTYPNIEIIVLDNHSTDNSYQVAKRFRKQGVKVYQNKKNLGVRSHNILLQLARGKYVHVLHSDDQVLPTFIEECVSLLECNPNVGFTVTERQEIDAEGKDIPTIPFYNRSCIIPGASQRCVLLMASYYVPSQTMFQRSILEKVGLYGIDNTTFMDWWLLYKCSCISDMGCIHKPLCRYRIWGGTETNRMVREMTMPAVGFLTRMEMLNWAEKDQDARMLERKEKAILKQADLTLKLGVDAIRDGSNELGRCYLLLAEAFSPEVTKSPLYQAMDEYLQIEDKRVGIDAFLEEKGLCGKRNTAYEPPEDAIIYERS